MATYTGTADANGDFNISFGGASYASAQKVTVTATKSGSSKSVELYAPADLTGGGVIRFSGSMTDFPKNVGIITLGSEIAGLINNNAFYAAADFSVWKSATGLEITGAVTSIGSQAFSGWSRALALVIPNSVTTIATSAFAQWSACKKLTLGTGLTSIGSDAFSYLSACDEIICTRTTPPTAGGSFLVGLKTTCVIKVPSASLTLYQTAPNWSAHASKMVGV